VKSARQPVAAAAEGGDHEHSRFRDPVGDGRHLRRHRSIHRRLLALGFIGALLGMFIARGLSLPEPLPISVGETSFPIVWSIVGCGLFVAVLSLLTRRRVYYD
jgi:uncharacterized membrane protein YeaQ/YmgE (transglycosylase-associated protein family)